MAQSIANRGRRGGLSAVVAAALIISACTSAPAPTTAPTAAPPTAAPATAGPTPEAALRIAYLSFAVANSYDAPMLAEAQNAAAAEGAILTVLDANNSVETQVSQLVTARDSGQYDGIIVQPIYGLALIPDIQTGIENGAQFAVLDQILGEDLSTSEKQVDGLAANVVFVQTEIGRKQGELVVQACQEFDLDPCNIGFLWSLKGVSSLDIAIDQAFNEVIADHPNIQVVADDQTFYTTHLGLTATQTMLTAHPEINMIVGADQGITGAVIAAAEAQRDDIVFIGYGGGQIAYDRIRCTANPDPETCANVFGTQYATVAQRPATEGRYVVEDLIQAIRSGELTDSRDPVSELPDDGIVTGDNVGDFTAEWPG